jgi:hypothetical protein
VAESMRLYPHPPVLLRRALVPDTLPGGYEVPQGQDVMISVYNIHHSPQVGRCVCVCVCVCVLNTRHLRVPSHRNS